MKRRVILFGGVLVAMTVVVAPATFAVQPDGTAAGQEMMLEPAPKPTPQPKPKESRPPQPLPEPGH